MANAVIYARFSSSKQREESIEDQVRVCKEAAEKAGDKIIKVYADSALSGRTDDRPKFQRMISDAEKGLFQVVYIYKTDRFARNRYDSAVNKAKLRKNGVRVVTAAETIPEGADGILMEAVLEGMAEYYSAQLAENVKRGIEGNAQKGKANGQTLYGYDINKDGYYVINKAEAHVVRTMFETFAKTGSTKAAIDAVAPSLPRSGKPWSISTVGNMLHREKYAGVYNYAGVRIEGGMPAIISHELFDRVQDKLNHKQHIPHKNDERYLLSGKLYDWQKNKYIGHHCKSGKGKIYYYYFCKNTNTYIPRDDFDSFIAEYCIRQLQKPGIVDTIVEGVLDAQDEALKKEKERIIVLKNQLARNTKSYDNAIETAINIGYNEKLKTKLQELEAERTELTIALAEEERSAPTITRDMVKFWVSQITKTSDTDVLLSSFVSQVIICENDIVFIVFTIQDMNEDVFDCIDGLVNSTQNEQKSDHKAAGEDGCSTESKMVDHLIHESNILLLPYGFALIAA